MADFLSNPLSSNRTMPTGSDCSLHGLQSERPHNERTEDGRDPQAGRLHSSLPDTGEGFRLKDRPRPIRLLLWDED